jgi:hypothetical protein
MRRTRVRALDGAAAKLGIPRTTLESKIKSLKINKNRFKGTLQTSCSRSFAPLSRSPEENAERSAFIKE